VGRVVKHKIYVETSVISYLAARPSLDAINSTRQHFSRQLWARRFDLDLLVSDAVLSEMRIGDEEAVRRRLEFCGDLSMLDVHPEAETLALHLLLKKAVPKKAFTDAVHIAIAALHEIQFIASWNFRHIVGAVARRNIEVALAQAGRFVPVIATPEEILESLK
jgi:predicted nucleic acid-binding protein